jgi:hypothetical protein
MTEEDDHPRPTPDADEHDRLADDDAGDGDADAADDDAGDGDAGALAGVDRSDDQPGEVDRRGVLALVAVVAVLVVCGVILLVGGEDGAERDTATPPDRTTRGRGPAADDEASPTTTATPATGEGGTDAESTTTADPTRAQVLEGLANGLALGSGGAIDHDEASCMAEALIDHLGIERIVELGEQSQGTDQQTNPLGALTPAEQDAAVTVMLPCADAETRTRIDPDT